MKLDREFFREMFRVLFVIMAVVLSFVLGRYALMLEIQFLADMCANPYVEFNDTTVIIHEKPDFTGTNITGQINPLL